MYKIADLNIEVAVKDLNLIKRLKQYKVINNNENLDMQVTIKKDFLLKKENSEAFIKDSAKWFKTPKGYKIDFYVNNKVVGKLDTDHQWEHIQLLYKKNEDLLGYSGSELLLSLAFRNKIFSKQGLVIHGSAMKYNNEGIIFSAPSGTGKTTHTTLWETHKNAEIINDDSPAIRMFEEDVFVYGTPWSGSSSKFTNDKLPLKAIVLLEQSQQNEMLKLDVLQSVSKLMPRILLPYQDERLMKIAIDNVSQLIARVPIYLLRCRPDVEAMELVEKCLGL
jgi:hypothetical protein